MAQIRISTLGLFLLVGVACFSLTDHAHAAGCDAIVGKWAWFIGGEVTVNPNGTFTQQSGNAGTWECNDGASGRFTFRWRDGGFVNSLALSPDGAGLTSTDLSQSYVTARRSAPARTPVQLARKGNCCQEAYGCETKRIEAEFAKKMASCHFPGNSGCVSEATSKKAAQLKAANEKLRSCNRAATSSGIAPPVPGGPPAAPSSGDEFHSTEGSGGSSQGCQPCGGETQASGNETGRSNDGRGPWGRRVKVVNDPSLRNSVADCFRKYRTAAQQDGDLAGVMINVLNTLDANKATSVTIRKAGLGDNQTKPEDLRKVTDEGTNATIYLDPVNPDQYLFGDNVHDVCGLLIHELEHALRMMAGTVSLRVCQLPGGRLEEAEISAQALGNVYRKLSKKPPLESYNGIRLPESAINPTRADFDNISVPGWWCP